MTKQVRETAAGKSISAYVILNPKGEHVATVQAHFSDGGTVTVDAWSMGGDKSAEKIARAMGYEIDAEGRLASGKHKGEWPYKVANLQQGRAGGGGYDKFTAALSGMVIDGHRMSNHCEGGKKPPKGRKAWPSDAKPPKGYSFSNYRTHGYNAAGERVELAAEEQGYASCYRREGFEYLRALGYTVIQAI